MDANQFGQWMMLARRNKGLTQQQVAQVAQKTKSYISALERGKIHPNSKRARRPPEELIDQIADYLGADANVGRLLMGYSARDAQMPIIQPGNVPPCPTPPQDYQALIAQAQQQLIVMELGLTQVRQLMARLQPGMDGNTQP